MCVQVGWSPRMISSCLRDVGALFHVQKRSTSAAKCIGHFCIIFPLRGLDLFPSCTTFWNQEIIWYSNWKPKEVEREFLITRSRAWMPSLCATALPFSSSPHISMSCRRRWHCPQSSSQNFGSHTTFMSTLLLQLGKPTVAQSA
jgi:hypothetical protein